MNSHFSLEHLLFPLPVATFLTDYWGKNDYLAKGRGPGHLAFLFSDLRLEEVLSGLRPEPTVMQLARGEDRVPVADLLLADGSIDLVALRNKYVDGFTIVLNGVERYDPATRMLTNAIEAELNFETQANAYVTPPGSQGFLSHFDDHDVLVAQLRGSKIWYIYGAESDVPPREFRRRDAFSRDGLGEPRRLHIEAGDLLYIPRGRVHAAETSDEVSVHLTFGIHPPSVLSLAVAALEAHAYADGAMLERLPPGFLNVPAIRRELVARLGEAIGVLDAQAIGRGLGELEDKLVRRGRCAVTGAFVLDSARLNGIDQATRLKRHGPMFSRVMQLDGGLALQFTQSLLITDTHYQPALRFVSAVADEFAVGDIPGLDADERLELARKLVIDGFLVQVRV